MENSFFEYRDKTGVESDSDTEIIDNSFVADESFTAMKKTPGKNHTVFVAESEESHTDDDSEEEMPNATEPQIKRSGPCRPHVVLSSDDDASKPRSIRQQSQLQKSFNKVVLSSSDDEEVQQASPEILPRRRPPIRPKSNELSDTSIIGRKKNKRFMLFDFESDNSIIIEHNKHKKMPCLKATPLKVDDNKMALRKKLNESTTDQSVEEDGSDDDENGSNDDEDGSNDNEDGRNDEDGRNNEDGSNNEDDSEYEDDANNIGRSAKSKIKNRNVFIDSDDDGDHNHENNDVTTKHSSGEEINDSKKKGDTKKTSNQTSESDYETGKSEGDDESEDKVTDDDDGPDEDEMVMSRATRMSIMGFVPKGTEDSDDSDFIQSDETSCSSRSSLNDLPDVTIAKSPPKTPIATQTETQQETSAQTKETPQKETDIDSSRISCSPFSSPLHDITNEINQIENSYESRKTPKNAARKENTNSRKKCSVKKHSDSKSKVLNSLLAQTNTKVTETDGVDVEIVSIKDVGRFKSTERVVDEDVTIVESPPEIIALSSDDEDDVREYIPESKAPPIKKSPKAPSQGRNEATIKQYLVPPSYPNSQVAYVKKHVRQNELAKLEGLKEDLANIKNLLENMDMDTLPDGGVRLIERLTALEHMVREQGNKVANMIVEPDMPTAEDISNDGFGAAAAGAERGLSWEELQRGSQAVQPRMFGKQAMATHMAERNLILERLRDLHESLASRPPESELAAQPPSVASKLMQHQLHALTWLRWRETQSPCGGILADDMGLGKTLTMIALIVSDKDNKIEEDDGDGEYSKLVRGGTLVVCPASLVNQWAGEVRRHCPAHSGGVCLHHGAGRAAQPPRLAAPRLVLTTYNLLQRDYEKNGVLMKVLWRRIILDEAHIVRNHKSATSMAVSALKGRRRWCLTGTPVQNKDLDLFALLKFLRCTPFDDLTTWKKWIGGQGGQERMSTIMRCILLRRTKLQLQQKGQLNCLPERTAHVKEVTLSKEEMNVYQKVLVFSKTLFAQFLHQRAERAADAEGAVAPGRDTEYAKMHKRMIALQGAKPVKSHEILVLLLRLRQVCCHCGLIAAMLDEESAGELHEDEGGKDLLAELNKLSLEDSRRKSKNKQEEEEDQGAPEEGTTVAEAIRSVLSPNNPVFQLTRSSSKITAVMECLRENVFSQPGHKAVVVSQWTSVLRLVEKELERERIKCVTLSGAVPVPARPPIIDRLNDPASDVRVMLLSLCAGGVGLNLCGANHLLLLDPHWNPQLEEQAQDRIYRVGQQRPVNIYRFMCVDTVEQSIRNLQLAKLELAENVLTGAKNTNASKLSIEDLKMLFNMGQSH